MRIFENITPKPLPKLTEAQIERIMHELHLEQFKRSIGGDKHENHR